QIEPGGAEYVIPCAARLVGALDVGALSRALDALCLRHDALRTTFVVEDGRPVALVSPDARVDFAALRLDEVAAREAAAAELRRPFDLSSGPLIRARLFSVTDEDHLFVLTVHHIVADGHALGILRRELSILHAAYTRGEEPRLPAPELRYAA